MGRLFGTDGVRGRANDLLTAELALQLSVAAAHVLAETGEFAGHKPRAVVGRDPRASGEFLEAAVVAEPDAKWGEVPHAFVTPKPGGPPPTEAEVIAWCRQRLAHFKCPKRVTFGPLPKTSTGKIQKFALRQEAAKT